MSLNRLITATPNATKSNDGSLPQDRFGAVDKSGNNGNIIPDGRGERKAHPQFLSHKVLFDLAKADFVAVHAEAFMDIGLR